MSPDSVRQVSKGDQSPIINGDYNSVRFGGKKLGNEVTTMLNVITIIPQIAKARGIASDSIQYPKDFLKKIEERFLEHKEEIKVRFRDLHILYRESYDDAKRNAGIDEFDFEEMCSYLRNLSMRILASNSGDPIKSLQELKSIFEEKFSEAAEKDYSVEAVEYFLHAQLIECNVFPNPID